MLVSNILQNAVRYADKNIQVTVRCPADLNVIFTVEGEALGIDETRRGAVVKPFVKGNHFDKSGYGMGLAIVARVAQWHEAELTISSSSELGGAMICVDFPAG